LPPRLIAAAFAGGLALAVDARADPPLQLANAAEDTSKILAVAARNREGAQGLFGRIGIAFLASHGNTEASSLNGELDLGYIAGAWRHAGQLQG
jgi:putative salt-induced outer membrane protein YdiY